MVKNIFQINFSVVVLVALFLLPGKNISAQMDTPLTPYDSTKYQKAFFMSVGSNESVIGLEISGIFEYWGFAFGGLVDGEEMPLYHNRQISHDDYTTKTYINPKYYFAINGNYPVLEGIIPYIAIGYTILEDVKLNHSNRSNNVYITSKDDYIGGDLMYGLGVSFFPFKNLAIVVGYNSVIKFKAGIGYSWK